MRTTGRCCLLPASLGPFLLEGSLPLVLLLLPLLLLPPRPRPIPRPGTYTCRSARPLFAAEGRLDAFALVSSTALASFAALGALRCDLDTLADCGRLDVFAWDARVSVSSLVAAGRAKSTGPLALFSPAVPVVLLLLVLLLREVCLLCLSFPFFDLLSTSFVLVDLELFVVPPALPP